jgi:hypothetical protein
MIVRARFGAIPYSSLRGFPSAQGLLTSEVRRSAYLTIHTKSGIKTMPRDRTLARPMKRTCALNQGVEYRMTNASRSFLKI